MDDIDAFIITALDASFRTKDDTAHTTLVITLRRLRRIPSTRRVIAKPTRERAPGSTTTKLFANDYFQRNNYISMRSTIVESSATTRLCLLFCARADKKEASTYSTVMIATPKPDHQRWRRRRPVRARAFPSQVPGRLRSRPVYRRRLRFVPYASPRVVVVEPP